MKPSVLVTTAGVAAQLASLLLSCASQPPPTPSTAPAHPERPSLLGPAAFAGIADEAQRSRVMFAEAGRVLQHPRCVNCHPAGNAPLRGDAQLPHSPPVGRGAEGQGEPGLGCRTCHTAANVDLGDRSVPGALHWALAPRSMTWEGVSLREICEQLKDPARNGDRTLEAIVEHSTSDALVAWGWNPGRGRQPAPGDQATFAALMGAWVQTGAVCP